MLCKPPLSKLLYYYEKPFFQKLCESSLDMVTKQMMSSRMMEKQWGIWRMGQRKNKWALTDTNSIVSLSHFINYLADRSGEFFSEYDDYHSPSPQIWAITVESSIALQQTNLACEKKSGFYIGGDVISVQGQDVLERKSIGPALWLNAPLASDNWCLYCRPLPRVVAVWLKERKTKVIDTLRETSQRERGGHS
uniref:Uncharacterized protein n=1 Tax=Ditylenchus dipsaci TaxID=166011 RepID=A0A915DHI4_9BILA